MHDDDTIEPFKIGCGKYQIDTDSFRLNKTQMLILLLIAYLLYSNRQELQKMLSDSISSVKKIL
jgi:hypothetical protein